MAENKKQTTGQKLLGMLGTGLTSGIGGAIGTGLGMLSAGQQHKRQQQLMELQQQNQMDLNKQGHQLQMDTWNKTNYGAQKEHMLKAGLNPALMYGMSGGGGTTTGSQSGGSAAGGNAPLMDIGQVMQGGLIAAQIKNINADTENKKAQATKTGGVDTDLGNQQILESISRIDKLIEEAKTEQEIQALNRAKKSLNDAMTTTEGNKQGLIKEQTSTETSRRANIEQATETDKARQDNIIEDTAIKKLQGILTTAQTGKTQQETTAIINKVAQDWQRLSQEMIGLTRQEEEKKIREYEIKLKEQYPTMWQMIGTGMREFVKQIDNLTGTNRERYKNPTD